MKLYLLRHAEALPGADDAARPLTKKGKSDAKALARFLRDIGVRFDVIYSSPLVRARETAEILRARCAVSKTARIRVHAALLNETRFIEFRRWLSALRGSENVLLVGHEPSMSERLCRLLKGKDPVAFKFPKTGLAGLERDTRNRHRLRLFVSPKQLRK